MEIYKNLAGDSGVAAYEIGNTWIRVTFDTGAQYLYTYESAGAHNIETMKKLAEDGHGLNSFIRRFVDKGYASKER